MPLLTSTQSNLVMAAMVSVVVQCLVGLYKHPTRYMWLLLYLAVALVSNVAYYVSFS